MWRSAGSAAPVAAPTVGPLPQLLRSLGGEIGGKGLLGRIAQLVQTQLQMGQCPAIQIHRPFVSKAGLILTMDYSVQLQ
jgi:hypothetical protein